MVCTLPPTRVALTETVTGAKTIATAVIDVSVSAWFGSEVVIQSAPLSGVMRDPKVQVSPPSPPLDRSELVLRHG